MLHFGVGFAVDSTPHVSMVSAKEMAAVVATAVHLHAGFSHKQLTRAFRQLPAATNMGCFLISFLCLSLLPLLFARYVVFINLIPVLCYTSDLLFRPFNTLHARYLFRQLQYCLQHHHLPPDLCLAFSPAGSFLWIRIITNRPLDLFPDVSYVCFTRRIFGLVGT